MMAGLAFRLLRLSRDGLLSRNISASHNCIHTVRCNVLCQESKALNLQDVSETVSFEDDDPNTIEADDIMRKRNKSRLRRHHQNIVHGKPPYDQPLIPYHHTVKYHRKMFGRYGASSGVNPGILWPTREELREKIEYEKVAYPDSFQVMVSRAKLKVEKELGAMRKREEEINVKMAKLEQWKHELEQRAHKKLMEAQRAKEKKERLMEEVRQHFGFKVDPRDERFKDMLEQKEKEESKRVKAEKKKAKQTLVLARLAGSLPPAAPTKETTTPPPEMGVAK